MNAHWNIPIIAVIPPIWQASNICMKGLLNSWKVHVCYKLIINTHIKGFSCGLQYLGLLSRGRIFMTSLVSKFNKRYNPSLTCLLLISRPLPDTSQCTSLQYQKIFLEYEMYICMWHTKVWKQDSTNKAQMEDKR